MDDDEAQVLSERELATELAQDKRRRRARATWTSMVLSLGAVLAIVLGLVLLVPRVSQVSQPPVNVQFGARAAADKVDFQPSVPVGLGQGWTATSVRTTNSTDQVQTWHVGYLTPTRQYAALEQGQETSDLWLEQLTHRGRVDGTQQVAGQPWQRWTGGRGEQNSLVHARGKVTTVVTGTATFAELAVLAASLHPAG